MKPLALHAEAVPKDQPLGIPLQAQVSLRKPLASVPGAPHGVYVQRQVWEYGALPLSISPDTKPFGGNPDDEVLVMDGIAWPLEKDAESLGDAWQGGKIWLHLCTLIQVAYLYFEFERLIDYIKDPG